MSRYINLDALIEELEKDPPFNWNDDEWELGEVSGYELAKSIVEAQPVIDFLKGGYVSLGAYRQVAWERDIAIDQLNSYGVQFGEKAELQRVKHGKWVAQDAGYTRFMCSACGSKNYWGYEKYCPNCGAKMRDEE
jgi:predicted RNA-binding Zn-ribbon protein involved in translation (DUF1610 family)